MLERTRPHRGGKAGFLVWIEKRYRAALKDPARLLVFSVGGIVIIVLGSGALFALAPPESTWTVFDHVAALLGGIGLLLALPALGYAARTDIVARYIYAKLTRERDLPAKRPDLKERTPTESVAQFDTGNMRAAGESRPPAIDEVLDQEPNLAPLALWLAPEAPGSPIGPSQIANALLRFALETAIEASGEPEHILDLLAKSQVFALGEPAPDDSSDLLHFEIEEDDGRDVVMMPVFTNWRVLNEALKRNPDWQTVLVLVISGGGVIDNRDSDVVLVVNPWSEESEFQLPLRR
ncbi:MAG TPA: hypothetical protein VKC63_06570 [Solirubrobacterales bacterium]|nr:hypothetical protein [Solirubrobacterales bacterium]